MAYIEFKNSNVLISASVVPVTENIIRITTDWEPNVSGFSLYLDKNKKFPMSKGEYLKYNTLYRRGEGWYELSKDGSVYIEPTVEPVKPVVSFTIDNGGTLSGEASQSVEKFEELVIPTVETEDGFEFVGWTPEIPVSGTIEQNITFTAEIIDKNVYFFVNGNGNIDGLIKQSVNDYSELVIPTPTPDKNHKFTGWFPSVPSEGEIDVNNTKFYAFFESEIPDRLKAIESEMTDAQLGLVENFDLTMTTAEEVAAVRQEITDVQLALIELYSMVTEV